MSWKKKGSWKCRSPQGERGLKLAMAAEEGSIERRSPQGERGLKFQLPVATLVYSGGRSPQGERGLKLAARSAR